jgi:hypothetical protein
MIFLNKTHVISIFILFFISSCSLPGTLLETKIINLEILSKTDGSIVEIGDQFIGKTPIKKTYTCLKVTGNYGNLWEVKELDQHDYKKVAVNDGKRSQEKWVHLCRMGSEVNLYFDPSIDQDIIKNKIQLKVE